MGVKSHCILLRLSFRYFMPELIRRIGSRQAITCRHSTNTGKERTRYGHPAFAGQGPLVATVRSGYSPLRSLRLISSLCGCLRMTSSPTPPHFLSHGDAFCDTLPVALRYCERVKNSAQQAHFYGMVKRLADRSAGPVHNRPSGNDFAEGLLCLKSPSFMHISIPPSGNGDLVDQSANCRRQRKATLHLLTSCCPRQNQSVAT